MKKEVSPVVLVIAGVVVVAALVLIFTRTLAPKAPQYTISPPGSDADGAVAKRANYLKAHGGVLGNGAAPPPASPRDER